MAILIDPPRWPAHGTSFSHLVSDSSLAELHAFAASAGIPERAFDEDHYDVPAQRYDALVAEGASPVTGGELIRRLRASGLRVPPRARARHALRAVRHRWPTSVPGAVWVRDELLDRWSQPHRRYHDSRHLLAVLDALDLLYRPGPVEQNVVLAAWFHDAVYDGVPGADEAASANLARSQLSGLLPPADVAEIVRLILITTEHQPPPDDHSGARLCDADLAILGASEGDYDRYRAAVRQDFAHLGHTQWRKGRAAVLTALLARDPLFRTDRGRSLWQATARANIARELSDLA
ncbi:MAG: DUF4031 domain-containing protein [Beutenbergiaceae bacterium]